jgi:protein O-mannosyl-transferase
MVVSQDRQPLPVDKSAPTPSQTSHVLLLLAVMVGLTVLAYFPTFSFSFVYDDGSQIQLNPSLTSWSYLPGFFTGHMWKFLLPDWPGNYYRPIFLTWLLANRMSFGLNSTAWHITTVLLHLGVTLFAFIVARQITRSVPIAFFTALLFGLHPIHVESVAWISGSTDPLMSLFTLAAFAAWIQADRNPSSRTRWIVASVLCYILGCLTKETAVFLPILVFAYEWKFRERTDVPHHGMPALLRTWPLCVAGATYVVVRSIELSGLIHSQSNSLKSILLTIPTIMLGYMRRLVWPVSLSVFYDTPAVQSASQWRFWLPLVFLALGIVAAIVAARRSKIAGFALLWIMVFLSPALIGLPAFDIGEWIHDRYLYLPSFGFCLLLVYALSHWKSSQQLLGFAVRPAIVLVLFAVAMAAGTSWEEQVWANNLLLFAHGTRIAPHSSLAKVHLATELFQRGHHDDALRLYQETITLAPDNWKNNMTYGMALYYDGRFGAADEQLQRTIDIAGTDCNQYFYQGMSRFSLDRYPEAEASFRKAIATGNTRVRYHFWLGYSLEKQGRFDEAKTEYETELKQHPETDTLARQRLEALLPNQN